LLTKVQANTAFEALPSIWTVIMDIID